MAVHSEIFLETCSQDLAGFPVNIPDSGATFTFPHPPSQEACYFNFNYQIGKYLRVTYIQYKEVSSGITLP